MSRLIDLDQLRVAIPDPVKRQVWLFGALTATMRGNREAADAAAASFTRFAEVYHCTPRGQ